MGLSVLQCTSEVYVVVREKKLLRKRAGSKAMMKRDRVGQRSPEPSVDVVATKRIVTAVLWGHLPGNWTLPMNRRKNNPVFQALSFVNGWYVRDGGAILTRIYNRRKPTPK